MYVTLGGYRLESVGEVVMFAGQFATGKTVSTTSTVNVQLPVFPYASVELQTTTLGVDAGVMGKADPEAGEHTGVLGVKPELSVTVGVVKVAVLDVFPA